MTKELRIHDMAPGKCRLWNPNPKIVARSGKRIERMQQGYRYHLTNRGGRVHHFTVGVPISDGDWDLNA